MVDKSNSFLLLKKQKEEVANSKFVSSNFKVFPNKKLTIHTFSILDFYLNLSFKRYTFNFMNFLTENNL